MSTVWNFLLSHMRELAQNCKKIPVKMILINPFSEPTKNVKKSVYEEQREVIFEGIILGKKSFSRNLKILVMATIKCRYCL